MMKIFKKSGKMAAIAIAVATLCLLNGCSDMLDKNPLGKLDESVFTTKDAIDKLLISCFSPLNGYINGVWGISSGPDNCFFGDLCSGNIHKGSTTGDLGELLQLERFSATSENDRVREKWVLVYGAIERCNDVLRTLDANEISDLSEADRIQVIAEARFLWAYYHFEAKKFWNMVPYIDETVEDPQRRVSNDRDIWPDIEADFAYAVEKLPASQNEPGRPTRSAAQAFLTKAYLFQQKYAPAKELLDEIIASGKYELTPNFYDNFNPEKNNNTEAVWQNQVAVNVTGTGYDRSQRGGDLSFPNAPDQPNLSGAGFNQPTFDLVNAYQTDPDGLPLIDSYFESDFKNDMGIESTEEFIPDQVTPVDPRLDWTVGRREVPYHDWAVHPGKDWIRDQISAGPYNQKKYVIQKSQLEKYSYDNTAKFNALNFNIIRYAAVLLWAAECEIEIGDPEKAREYVNRVRARARDGIYVRLGEEAPFGNGETAANYKVDVYNESWGGKDKEWLRKRVRFEHRLEFADEGHYFFDLVRWDIAEEYINAYIAREKKYIRYLEGVVFTENDRYFAIPLIEIDRSYKDGVPTLKQNPGY
ncbi:MAG: RagB/SusD family nutrient uptake outer membrane protein [Tannerellaceae bacterium]|nr:RagB/SusD family nutrient uptake outer membrane protein [Tannerellaceae bacterium]